jgi:hypothetical protein
MNYGALAERLIEAQRPMLGQRAIDVAQSVDGLSVDDDGAVESVDGGDVHDRSVIAALVDEYVSIMGQSAHNRLDDAVAEFEGDLVLPENLGGPAEIDGADADAPDAGDADDADTGATTETTTEATGGSTAESRPGEEPTTDAEPAESGAGTAGAAGAEGDADHTGADPDEVVTNIWGEEHESEAGDTDADPTDVDIESVYITVTDEGGWEQPVPVGRAIVEAVTNVTDLAEEDLDDLSTYVDTHRIVRLLETDTTDPVSFEIEGHDVTLHADGGIHVQ